MQKHLVRPQFATGFQKAPFGRRTILHSLADKALLESHSKGATHNPIECANSLIWQFCLKEMFCGAKTVETAAAQAQ